MLKNFIIVATLLLAAPVFAQQGTNFTPTNSQHRKLVSQREKISKLQAKLATLQIEFNYLAAKFRDECRSVALENHWPDGVQCDPNSLTFFATATPAGQPYSAPQPASATPVKPAEEPKKP